MSTHMQRCEACFGTETVLTHNTRSSTAPPLEVTILGLPATFAKVFGFAEVTAAA